MGEPSLPFVSRKTRLSLNLRKALVSTATDGNTKVTYHLERRLKIHGVRVSQHFGAHVKSRAFLTGLQRLLCVIQMHLLPSTPYTLSHLGGFNYNLLYTLNDPYMHQHHVNNCTGNGCIALYPVSAFIVVHHQAPYQRLSASSKSTWCHPPLRHSHSMGD